MSGFAVKLERLVFTGVLGSGGESEDIFGSGREEKISPPSPSIGGKFSWSFWKETEGGTTGVDVLIRAEVIEEAIEVAGNLEIECPRFV